jgi:DNA-binding transcriptional MerR regulator
MRISELSAVSRVPLPTVKFYLREGLLRPGSARAVNQAQYGDDHVRRIRLIRALTDVGGLRLREVRAVLAAIDDEQMPLHDMLGVAQYALAAGKEVSPPVAEGSADREVERLLATMGWTVNETAPGRRFLADAMATLRGLGWRVSADDLIPYARAVDKLAATEVASIPDRGPRGQIVEHMIVGTVMFEAILAALRRLAQEHHSAHRFGDDVGTATT